MTRHRRLAQSDDVGLDPEPTRGELSLVAYELYSGIEVRPWPFFVRLDGWKFQGLARRLRLARPFDKRLPNALAAAGRRFFPLFSPALCYILSDEVNLLFLEPTVFRHVEKIDSVFAGLLSAHVSVLLGAPAAFDCRIIPVGRDNVVPYLVWRQAECWRNHNNAWAQWTLIDKAGLSGRSANRALAGLKSHDLFRLCEKWGVDLASTPLWQRRGLLLYPESYRKQGYNPITGARVLVERHRVKADWAICRFDSKEGETFLTRLLRRPNGHQ